MIRQKLMELSQIKIIKILKILMLSIIDMFFILLGNVTVFVGSLLKNATLWLLALIPVFLIGIVTGGMVTEELLPMLIVFPIIGALYIIIFLVVIAIFTGICTIVTQISVIIGTCVERISLSIFKVHNKIEAECSLEINELVEENRYFYAFGVLHYFAYLIYIVSTYMRV